MPNFLGGSDETHPFPEKPFPLPANSRIEKKSVPENEVLYLIPANGSSKGLLPFALIFCGISIIFGSIFLFVEKAPDYGVKDWILSSLFLFIFGTSGLAMLYASMRRKYAAHFLFLGKAGIRLQRVLFRRKTTYILTNLDGIQVSKKVFHTENYQPIYGVEIRASDGKRIRFGTVLKDKEKDWLCAEIQEFLRTCT